MPPIMLSLRSTALSPDSADSAAGSVPPSWLAGSAIAVTLAPEHCTPASPHAATDAPPPAASAGVFPTAAKSAPSAPHCAASTSEQVHVARAHGKANAAQQRATTWQREATAPRGAALAPHGGGAAGAASAPGFRAAAPGADAREACSQQVYYSLMRGSAAKRAAEAQSLPSHALLAAAHCAATGWHARYAAGKAALLVHASVATDRRDPSTATLSDEVGKMPIVWEGKRRKKEKEGRKGEGKERVLGTPRAPDACWLIDDEAEVVRTVVDAGRAFLHAQGRVDKRLRPLLKREGRLRKAAELARRDWKAIQAYHVGQLRDADVINRFTALTHLQRASARVVRSLCTDHSTFAAFLDVDGYIMRWQRLMILVTLVLSTLLTSIWFYYSRGANCCAELRAILECDPVGPCRGYAADCADLQAQFTDVQGPYIYSDDVGSPPTSHMYIDSWVCHAFPDSAYVTDQFFVGLISVAVALPVDLFLVRAFEIANEGELPGNWVTRPAGKWRLLLGNDFHNGWALADKRHPVSDLALHLICVGEEWGGLMGFALSAVAARIASLLRRARGVPEPEPEAAAAVTPSGTPSGGSSSSGRAARADALAKRFYASAGLLGVYVVWTIFAWFIFTYGMLIYRQLGSQAQTEFSKTWGVGYALDNATEWQEVFKTAAKTAVVLVVLDMLRLTRNSKWFEALLFNGAARGWWAQTRKLVKLQARLTED